MSPRRKEALSLSDPLSRHTEVAEAQEIWAKAKDEAAAAAKINSARLAPVKINKTIILTQEVVAVEALEVAALAVAVAEVLLLPPTLPFNAMSPSSCEHTLIS